MSKIKENPWPLISVIVAVLAIIISITLNLSGRPDKRLQVQVLSNTSLLSIDPEISSRTQIYFDDKPVQSLSLILLKFENTGNVPITPADYSEPIKITLSPHAEISEAVIQETNPDNINFPVTIIGNNQIKMDPALTNEGDIFVLKVVAVNNDGTLDISGRIIGVTEIEIVPAISDIGIDERYIRGLSIEVTAGIIAGAIGVLVVNITRFIAKRKNKRIQNDEIIAPTINPD